MGENEEETVEISFDDDVEGDVTGSDDYCFVPVGEPVLIVPVDDEPVYDSQNLPLRPFAVSEKLGVLFVSHSNGFFVARTKEVIQTAKEIKEKKSGLSIKESCIVDVLIGKVYILALSVDSSTLAASVAGNIHFFSVRALLNKEQNPYFSSSLGDSSSIRDMQWTKRTNNQYVILSDQGKLYYGADQHPLKHVMDNVDSVEWSVNGKFLAVATKNFLSILSSKFKKKISISLSFKTWVDDSDFKGTIKVDSIRWIRPDCIILGCFQLGADGTETDYLIQVVTSKHGKITDASSEPTLLSFSYVFQGLVDDIVPYGSGPYMSLGYVANCELAIAANRKNTDQHIVLLGWPQENVKQVALIDNLRDTLRPKISLQENGDDNIVLGLCLDKVTYNDKVEVVLGADYKELSPFCLLLCLSLDGKLSMFQVASATGVSSLSGDASFLSEEEVDDSPTAVFSENGSSDYSDNSPAESAEQDYLGIQIQSPEVNKKEPYIGEGQFPLKKTNLEESANFINSKNLITEEESKFSLTQQIQHTTGKQSPLLAKQGTDARQLVPSHTTASFKDLGHTGKQEHFAGFNSQLFPTNSSTSLFSQTSSRNLSNENDSVGNYVKTTEKEKPLGGFSSQLFPAKSSTSSLSQSTNLFPQLAIKTLSNENNLNKEIPEKQLGSATFKAAEERKSFPNTSYSPSSILPSGYNQSNSSFTSSYDANLQGGSFGSSSNVKSSALPANHKSTMPFQSFASPNYSSKDQRFVEKDNKRINSSGRVLSSEPRLSKQSGNVEEMIKELEELLERIEGPGGYREACTVLLDGSVLELEKGMGTLFGRWRQGKRIMDEQLLEVQSFRDKTVQVAAKKFYMEGIIKQASDDQYWDLWNKQKLSPELELKRQHILKVNQELTSQLIELERHLHTLEIKAFGEDRGQMRQRGLPTRYGSSRHGQSLRSLQEIMNSQLAAAEQLSESLSRQMNLLSVESPNTKKADARRELFEEIGIPYSNASFGSPEKERAIDNTPSNKKVLVPLNSGAKSSSRRNQLTAVKILGCESSRRRRDSLDRSWASFEPPKTTVKRETRRTPNVDRSSLLMGKEHIKSQVMDRSAFAPPELRTTPLTTLQSSNDIGAWERTSKQAFETSSALPQAYKTPDFSKRSSDQTFSLSRNTNETKSSDIFGTSQDVPNKFQPDNAANKNKNLSGLFPFSSSQFSIFGSSSSLNSSSSVPSTTSVPSSSSLSPAVATNKASSFKLASSVTQPVVPSLSPASSATVFKGSSFTLNSSLSVPSTSPTPSIAPSLPTISFGNSFSTLKPSTTDSNAVLPSLSSVSPPLPFGKPVSSLTSTPSTNLPNESLEKETQPPKPENSNKVEDNGSSIPSSIPTSDASTLFQSVKIPSLNSTGPAVQDASNSVLERKITTDVVSPAVPPASEIEKIENQEDDMEEEAPETNSANQLNLGGLGGFGLGSSSNSNTPKQNPFGSSFANTVPTPILSPMPVPSGELFRPPSFSLSPPTQPPQPTCGFGAFSGNTVPTPTQSGGFGQPSKIGAGQQALGSLLGSFGQSRQFAAPTPSPVGGFGGGSGSTPPSGGFAGIASGGGGFASLASGGGGFVGAGGGGFGGSAGGGGFGGSPGGGFAGAASPSVGGFGGAATPNVGGFASAAGGFAGAAPGGGGFGGAAPGGGFGGFNGQQGGGGFSSFGNNAGGTGTSPSALFTQMRK